MKERSLGYRFGRELGGIISLLIISAMGAGMILGTYFADEPLLWFLSYIVAVLVWGGATIIVFKHFFKKWGPIFRGGA